MQKVCCAPLQVSPVSPPPAFPMGSTRGGCWMSSTTAPRSPTAASLVTQCTGTLPSSAPPKMGKTGCGVDPPQCVEVGLRGSRWECLSAAAQPFSVWKGEETSRWLHVLSGCLLREHLLLWHGNCCFRVGFVALVQDLLLWARIAALGQVQAGCCRSTHHLQHSQPHLPAGVSPALSGSASSIGKSPSGLQLESDRRCKCFAVHSCASSEDISSLPEAGCSAPQIQNGRIVPAPRSTYAHKDNVTFECEPGYVIRGPRVVQCQQNNTWQPPVPICEQGKWPASTAGAILPQCPLAL